MEIAGVARSDRRTKDLTHRLHPGNIAIIDHDDLDLLAAQTLLDKGVAAVANARRSCSGRYPNIGPLILVRAGVPLLDDIGEDGFNAISEGDRVTLVDEQIMVDGVVVAKGHRLDEKTVLERMDHARASLSATVEEFAENTLAYVRREQDLLIESVALPDIKADFRGRHALVVVRGYHYREDLRALKSFVAEMKPIVVAVDGAADTCLEMGIKPHVILGDCDSVSAHALRSGAEVIVHPQGDWRRRFLAGEDVGEAPEVAMVKALGIEPLITTAPGMSEDVALLLANEKGAELIVAVGTHNSAVELLDKGRKGMASTFLVRLRIGPKLVDAKGVSLIYRHTVRTRDLVILVGAALASMVGVGAITPSMRLFWVGVFDQISQIVRGIF